MEWKRKELGLDKKERCKHRFRVDTTREARGEFVKIRKTYRCIKCGIETVYTWCEHV